MRRFGPVAGVALGAFFLVSRGLNMALVSSPRLGLGRNGLLVALLGVGLLVAEPLLPLPSSLVMVVLGVLFGGVLGTLLSLVGGVGGSLLGFAIGRRGGPLMARLVRGEHQARVNRLLERWGAWAIMATRPMPLLADTTVILAGASPLNWKKAAVAATLGSLPPALLFSLAGATVAGVGGILLVLGLVAVLAGGFWVAGHWAERRLARAVARDE